MTSPSILFISDIHLSPQRPAIAEIFLEFLQKEAKKSSALYILGDMFDIWVGDDDLSLFHRTILNALKQVTEKSVPVFVMHGNHDFMLGRRFEVMTGCQLIPDPTVIKVEGERIVLMHGDSLCTLDKEYQRFRRVMRKSWVKRGLGSLPLFFKRFLAKHIQATGQERSTLKARPLLDVSSEAVQTILLQHNARHLIHGHTHRPTIHDVFVDGTIRGKRIVLGDWCKPENIFGYELGGRGLFKFRFPSSIFLSKNRLSLQLSNQHEILMSFTGPRG